MPFSPARSLETCLVFHVLWRVRPRLRMGGRGRDKPGNKEPVTLTLVRSLLFEGDRIDFSISPVY